MNTRGPQYAKQFLYSLLVPKTSTNEMTTMNYDNRFDSYFRGFRFLNNKTYEQSVFRFIQEGMKGNINGFDPTLAKEWFKEMEQIRKVAYLMTHDKSLAGDVFSVGNLDRGIEPSFNVIPTSKIKPRFLETKVLNEQALKTMQSYLTGSYFLDPIELYRLTVGLDKTMNALPNPNIISERVKYLWSDVGQNARTIDVKENLGQTVYRLSKSSVEGSMLGNREHMKRNTFSERLLQEQKGKIVDCP